MTGACANSFETDQDCVLQRRRDQADQKRKKTGGATTFRPQLT